MTEVSRIAPEWACPAAHLTQCGTGDVLVGASDEVPRPDFDRLENVFAWCCAEPGRLAVDSGDERLTFRELDARSNRLARYLLRTGIRPGDRVALLFDGAVASYVAMIAVLKTHAAYVPLDKGFPQERLRHILADSGARAVLTAAHLAAEVSGGPAMVIALDDVCGQVDALDGSAVTAAETGPVADDICYLIYTSGSTGMPKGVPISHAAICNFVQVAARCYGMLPGERVYQGMTIAFDFSIEEIWVPWCSGATLVPKPPGVGLVGADLHRFLVEREVTALCCVPTLLATLEDDLPGLRFLLVSGEACPPELVARWHRAGRRFLNVYGPTEATVTATWTVLDPDRPVTIGVPLPSYTVAILAPDGDRALPRGEAGEIAIAGVGLAEGYLNNPAKTDAAFIPDFLGLPDNPSRRIYRTGDLGLITEHGQIEYRGRIDTQVKIRGYRVELAEIETVLAQFPGIAHAVVDTHAATPGELVGYYTTRDGTAADEDALAAALRHRLPPYMVPSYLMHLSAMPMLPSDKADRANLPAPHGGRRGVAMTDGDPARGDTERALADALAGVLKVDDVPATAHFFDDLGANSLLLARFGTAARTATGIPGLAIQDIYQHPSVRELAVHLDTRPLAEDTTDPDATARPVEPARGTPRYALCGALQLLAFLCYLTVAGTVLDLGYQWITEPVPLVVVYLRALAVGGGGLACAATLPIAAKWLLIGRWKPMRVRVWSLGYARFWLAKTLVLANPVARLAVGSPLYALYLRALGARVGPRALILTPHVPICADLITIGADAVIRNDSYLNGYRVTNGVLETGPVRVGDGAFVGERSVLDIGSTLGGRAQLGHASTLHTGQTVPHGACWHGSPARPADQDTDYQTVPAARCGTLRRAVHVTVQLVVLFAVAAPLLTVGLAVAGNDLPTVGPLLAAGTLTVANPALYLDAAWFASLLLGAALVVGTLLVVAVPRLTRLVLRDDRVHPLYGPRHTLLRLTTRLTNIRFLTYLFGDSAAIVHYLRVLGYDLGRVLQTGSNFGMAVRHDLPSAAHVGRGTMVSDGLSVMNAEFSSTGFRVRPAHIGERNYLGNNVSYPAGGRTGDNCLLATKVMVPVTGPMWENVGMLGSPPFAIPRSAPAERQSDPTRGELRAKARHNAVTMLLYLAARWVYLVGIALLALVPLGANGLLGPASVLGAALADVVWTVLYFAAVERIVTAYARLRPVTCSLYRRDFWRVERFWKVPAMSYAQLFNGTAFKGMFWRLLGVRVGRRLFDDGAWFTERPLVALGDDVTLGVAATLQSHSMEDGTFKADRIHLADATTVGTDGFVHYGVTTGEGAVLEANAFLMKGEHIDPGHTWRGNPAHHTGTHTGPGASTRPAGAR